MVEKFDLPQGNYLPADSEIVLTLAGPKLHGLHVTDSKLNYHGSITIDQEILAEAGLYPLEFVNIWNKQSGARISTYVLPGPEASRVCCLNGAAARTCQIGDCLIITSERKLPRRLLDSYSVSVLTFHSDNSIDQRLSYRLDLSTRGCLFCLSG